MYYRHFRKKSSQMRKEDKKASLNKALKNKDKAFIKCTYEFIQNGT